MKRRLSSRGHERGASLIEFVVVIPLFGLLVFGIFEMAWMYRTKATLASATFEAAQAGSLNNLQIDSMRKGLAEGMMPLYVRKRDAVSVALTYAETYAKVRAGILGSVEVVSPTKTIFNAFKTKQPTTLSGTSTERNMDVIPNDNLMWRDASQRTVSVNGQNIPVTLQDANMLKVKTFWCHRLMTPFLDKYLYEAMTGLTIAAQVQYRRDVPEQRKCDLLTVAGNDYYVAIVDSAVTRIQSPVVATSSMPN